MSNSRIPTTIDLFHKYIIDTDDLQLSIDPNTNNPVYQNWGWTAAESAAWTAFRTKDNALYKKYSVKKLRNSDITEKLNLNRKDCLKYDHDKDTGHHLLDKIALSGSVSDCETFKVKRGTVLQDATLTRVAEPGSKEAGIVVREIGHLFHKLAIVNIDKSKKKGREKGIKEIEIWRALVKPPAPPANQNANQPPQPMPVQNPNAEPDDSQYVHVGEAKRGLYLSTFESSDVGSTAWYKARMKNTRGEKGNFSKAVSAPVG
ncbi:MAG: hypothetical protein HY063_11350 [Bacteroidetes bacterium]|nr:hypothetical protein [Bacteroidota bacterium]